MAEDEEDVKEDVVDVLDAADAEEGEGTNAECADDEEDTPDVVEVSDELVRTTRYGRRNYRDSIGADNRRHWRGEFVASEQHTTADDVEDVFDEEIGEVTTIGEPDTAEPATESTAAQTFDDGEDAVAVIDDSILGSDITDAVTESEDDGVRATGVADVYTTQEPEPVEEGEDPLQDVSGLEEVTTEPADEPVTEVTAIEEATEESEVEVEAPVEEVVEEAAETSDDQSEESTDGEERTDTVS